MIHESLFHIAVACTMTASVQASENVRTRSDADAEKFLLPIATQLGRSFIKYDENKRRKDSKLHLAAMEAAGATACMKALVSGGGGKAFTKDQLKTGLRGVFSSLATAWHMTPEHEEEWVATLTLSLANAHTHVLQALGRKPPPAWVLRLVSDDTDAEKTLGFTCWC